MPRPQRLILQVLSNPCICGASKGAKVNQNPSNRSSAEEEIQALLAQSDSGSRNPAGLTGRFLWLVALSWALFQLWYASPLPFVFNFGVFNDTQARAIHLSFALFLAFTAYPAFRRSPRLYIPWHDWIFALLGALSAAYLLIFESELARRSGAPTQMDLIAAVTGMLLLLEATRRALGPPLMIVALVFLVYTFGGPYMPDVIAHAGASLNKTMSHQWLTSGGVFGIALGVSTSFVFLFVLFGALLEKAGAGNYFTKVSFSLLGHMRGGPAKAAVVSSGLSGLISGSSIANVVTTGTFTIPLMKRVGFPAHKAGAVEVASSTNGQLTPPIMGAAAFLMVEYVGIPYIEVIQHAILPALISYIALIYIVHLEALKAGMQGLPRRHTPTLAQALLSWASILIGFSLFSLAVYYLFGWTKEVLGQGSYWLMSLLVALGYLLLVRHAATYPDLKMDDPNSPVVELPEVAPTVKSGLYYLLPVFVLVWCLTVERFSPGLSAFWASAFMIGIVLTHKPLKAFFRQSATLTSASREGVTDLFEGLVTGARNMIGIGVATAAAGIVVGTVTLTGVGLVMTEFVEFLSGGNIMLMLIFTAAISLILGMGLPTTANYIVVSTLMAPVIVTIGAQNGLIVPLVAVHLFVFYFGILADDTPPVGLAAFAAAAIARSDPIRTGVQGFAYDIRTAVLPFMFIFNTELLLIGIESWMHLFITVVSATLAILIFAAATQGYWLVKLRGYEIGVLLVIAFSLFRPGFWWDQIYPPDEHLPSNQIERLAATETDALRLWVEGETLDGTQVRKLVVLPLAPGHDGAQRLADAGLMLSELDDRMRVDMVGFGSAAQRAGLDFDWEITEILVELDRPAKHWVFIPALLLLLMMYLLQRSRARVLSKA
ncbi:TRAP transporter fused permease subunit [Nitrincola tapanii]|uniref:TRAP transporter fused permease subunit n=1 Tax=Nitrincola tapanii TaxID=1708751 RepID=A0A5A9W0J8_9GAMM|nr:TRAP transporter fused permease subunit [Nitrincola tapanii]